MQPVSIASSPLQAVLDLGMGDHCGHCLVCDAYGAEVAEEAAWQWLNEHECGVETVRELAVASPTAGQQPR